MQWLVPQISPYQRIIAKFLPPFTQIRLGFPAPQLDPIEIHCIDMPSQAHNSGPKDRLIGKIQGPFEVI